MTGFVVIHLMVLYLALYLPYGLFASPVFVLIGGTGELSSKYLWDAVYRQIHSSQDRSNSQMKIFTSGRSDDTTGNAKLQKILNKMHCNPTDGPSCEDKSKNFAESIEYVKLENDPDYAKFCFDLFDGKKGIKNITRVFWYLATPPTYYPIILMSLHTRCRNSSSEMRVALEKPFWKTDDDFAALSRILKGRFSPKELYFVDHYLAKPTVRVLESFKLDNSRWFKIRNLQKAELVLLERDNVQDTRLNYYDNFGVVRDTIQCHLGHIALKLLEECDEDLFGESRDEDDERDLLRDILGRIRPFLRSDWVLGQHKNYKNLTKGESRTPTFAGLRFKFDVAPSSGATVDRDLVFVSGKYLDAKRSYARLIFRDSKQADNAQSEIEVVFLFSAPIILVRSNDKSRHFSIPVGWHLDEDKKLCEKWIHRIFTRTPCSGFQVFVKTKELPTSTYESIIAEFISDRQSASSKSFFTKWTILEMSWQLLWSDVFKFLDSHLDKDLPLAIYDNPGEVLGLLFEDTVHSTAARKVEL